MLELQKFVLQQVSDNRDLFQKELRKSLGWLDYGEIEVLREWTLSNFGDTYKDILTEEFGIVEA